jgi:uncharacterized protein (DUF2237 family)
MKVFYLLLAFNLPVTFASSSSSSSRRSSSSKNVYGDDLQPCSSDGMAMTGYTRTGYCIDNTNEDDDNEDGDDQGSHHICIDLSSTTGGNFCDVTGQSDWCTSEMACAEDADASCPIQNWCVCQWAFASYIAKAGGCDQIQDVVCDSINMEALVAYQQQQGSKYTSALECVVDRCGLDASNLPLRTTTRISALLASIRGPKGWMLSCLVVGLGIGCLLRYRQNSSLLQESLLEGEPADPATNDSSLPFKPLV